MIMINLKNNFQYENKKIQVVLIKVRKLYDCIDRRNSFLE